jgi:iron complex transport system ATP-binding protein
MHDLNLTALFADYVYVMSEGSVWGSGTPTAILNDQTMLQVYGIDLPISTLPNAQVPFILPQAMRQTLTA